MTSFPSLSNHGASAKIAIDGYYVYAIIVLKCDVCFEEFLKKGYHQFYDPMYVEHAEG